MGSTKLLVAVAVALIVGLAAGILICGMRPGVDPCNSPGNQIIDVSATGGLSCADAKISRTGRHRVAWKSPKGTTLEIVFREPVPFKVECDLNHCDSELPDPKIALRPYGYDVRVTSPQGSSSEPAPMAYQSTPTPTPSPNGRIIIEK